jgi:hypothetical protein
MTGNMFADKKVGTFPVFLFLVLSSLFSTAQEVVVCKSQQDGYPRGASTVWAVDSFPVQLTLFYNNGKTTIDERNLNFIIEAEAKLGLAPAEASVVVSQGRNWASTTFSFQRSGKYVVSAYRSDRSVMAATQISISGPDKTEVKQESSNSVKSEAQEPVLASTSSSYEGERFTGAQVPPAPKVSLQKTLSEEEQKTLAFEEVNIAFGTAISGRKLDGVSESFLDAQARKGIVVQLSNPKPFAGGTITMDVWKKSGPNASDYDEMVVNSSVSVTPKAYTVQAPLKLFKKGDYKVSFFTSDMVWIGSAYLSVK